MSERSKGGRPVKAPQDRKTERVQARLTPEQREKYEAIGGDKWLRAVLDAMPPIGRANDQTNEGGNDV